ncbi:MAG: NAD(P)-dependent oxidoreductase [Ramlibacter sp.]|nr:NAD(P)-dependent oxidoreductase [Ramlibacter sp.]
MLSTTAGAVMKIAVLGIGFMGFPMARRLCEAGHEVHVWNRSRDKAERVAAFGATVHASAAQAAGAAEVVVSMLENGAVVEDVLFAQGAARAMKPGTLVIDMASIKPREARDHAARLADIGVAHLDAPVSGGTVGAEAGTLVIMAGGRPEDFERAQPVFQVFGRATHVGPHGTGQLTKLAKDSLI